MSSVVALTFASLRDRRRAWLSAAGLVVLVVVAGSCRDAEDQAPLPPPPAVVEVSMREYSFDYDRPVPAGRVLFEVRNDGEQRHEFVLVRLPDHTNLEELLASPTPLALHPVFAVPPRQPDKTASFAVKLTPGRYGIICFVQAADGDQHHQKGMFDQFRVE